MPFRTFVCATCEQVKKEFQTLHATAPDCDCGSPMVRDYAAECGGRSVTGAFDKPIDMYSVACSSVKEINDLRAKCPGVEISADRKSPMYGIPIARTRSQKLRILKATDFQEYN